MKFLPLALAVLVAGASSVQAWARAGPDANPLAMPEPHPEAIKHYCHRVGQPCGKVKRAAEAVAEAEAAAEPHAEPIKHYCHRVGQPCGKAKRAAEALAKAAADAYAIAEPNPEAIKHYCHRVGQPCG